DAGNVAPARNFLPLPSLASGGAAEPTPQRAGELGAKDRASRQAGGKAPAEAERWFALLEGSGDARGNRPRSLMLVEPTLAQLAYLEALLGLGDRIANGLEVVVVGPPP